MEKRIETIALLNALKHGGKAQTGSVLGAVFAEYPSLKEQAQKWNTQVQEIVKKVNSIPFEEQKRLLEKREPGILEEKKKKKERDLPQLPNVKGNVVTRMAPEPSKYPHFGHALTFLINYLYAKKYHGRCILRIDDTNPEKAKKEYYQALDDALRWLEITPDKKVVASEQMDEFYRYAGKLIDKEAAYVCFCEQEKMRQYRMKSMLCEHREQTVKKNVEEWSNMLNRKYQPGEATLRLRGDMDSTNAVMRDPVLFRVCTIPHPIQKTKYIVWPMYDFESAIGEELCNVTHILRSIEFGTMRTELQNYIKETLGLPRQEVVQYGRFSITGAETHGRVIREKIMKGEVAGWDDPRLVTLASLRRRGIVPETFRELVYDVGLSPTETRLDWSAIAATNRKIIDPTTPRFFFVKDPKKIKIKQTPKEAVVPNHPENKTLGQRKIVLGEEFYIQDQLKKGKVYRLMHLFNFKDNICISQEYDPKLKAKIIHGVPVNGAIDVEVLMDDGTVIKGKGEKALKDLEDGTTVQFERLFFCKLENKEKMLFVYTHD